LALVQAHATQLSGPVRFEPVVHRDDRAIFLESFRQDVLSEAGAPALAEIADSLPFEYSVR
jgi:dTDP-4-dehydrorhamnose 3,5-epimerase-like enzyme